MIIKELWFWQLSIDNLDENMIFRCKATGEFILFDKYGQWD